MVTMTTPSIKHICGARPAVQCILDRLLDTSSNTTIMQRVLDLLVRHLGNKPRRVLLCTPQSEVYALLDKVESLYDDVNDSNGCDDIATAIREYIQLVESHPACRSHLIISSDRITR
jgi:hypothetical protein